MEKVGMKIVNKIIGYSTKTAALAIILTIINIVL